MKLGLALGLAISRSSGDPPNTLIAERGLFSLNGLAMRLACAFGASGASFNVTGIAAALFGANTLAAQTGLFSLNGVAMRPAYSLGADRASFNVTGMAVTFSQGTAPVLTANPGIFTLTGIVASLLEVNAIAANAGGFALTGIAAGLKIAMPAASSAFTLTGNAATLTGSSPSSLTFQGFATENGGGATATFSSVPFGTAAANRVIVVIAAARATGTSPSSVSSMTIGGKPATQVPSAAGSVDVMASDIWYASLDSGTSGTVVVNWNAANTRSGIYVYEIHTSNPVPTNGNGTAANNSMSLNSSLTVPTSGFGIAGATSRQTGNANSFTNATLDGDNQLAGAAHQFFCGHTTATGSVSVTAQSAPIGNSMTLSLASWNP
jgi:hypothetical protein